MFYFCPNLPCGKSIFQGHFELISLTGSFVPTKNGATGKRSGAMSVSFVDSKGIVAGGGVAGRVVAAAPVEVSSKFPSLDITFISCPRNLTVSKFPGRGSQFSARGPVLA